MFARRDKENAGVGGANAPADPQRLRRGKTVEEIYKKMTPLEHILQRPDTYVGSTEYQSQEMFVFDEGKGEIVLRKIDYVPALYKIFDEILVNAADNSQRDPKGMDLIEVTINAAEGCISVLNNGRGVPVEVHKEHGIYVPELIFGELLTSDNYDDKEKKVTGGRNGYGAKLTNAFSKRFVVETADQSKNKKLSWVCEQNMSKKHKPSIGHYTGKDFTKVTFWPDFARFGMTRLEEDIKSLMMKRVYDIAGSTSRKVKVVLNGNRVPCSNFEEYCKLYMNGNSLNGMNTQASLIYERVSDRWEVGMGISDGSFQQVSFVNSISTTKGGTHVNHVADQMVQELLSVVNGKNRGGIKILPRDVKNHVFIFINCLVENPAFDSQTKETLTTKQSKFGSTCEISEEMLKKIKKSGVVQLIMDLVKAKEKVAMGKQLTANTKNQTRVLGIPKLEDANDAGGRNAQSCTLILTEGDSAKSLAVAGLSVVGRDKFGVFPLRGKVLNVRDANFKQVTGNAEIQNLLKIMGLDSRQKYDSTRGLRYGSIMIMTDQDHDGSHIKGLLINLIHHFWPSLVHQNGFLKEFVTPIVKVWRPGKKDTDRRDEQCFFTMTEYEQWKHRTNKGKGFQIKYYKGLGTSTAKEAKEYFRDIERHELGFRWSGNEDDEAIDLAFNKKRPDDRKEWINQYVDGQCVDHSQSHLTYRDFINKELVQFAKYDTSRSVPSVVDGFKPSQRKVLFASFKKKLKHDIKVAQFVGYISEQAAYHHGEKSLENTVIGLAQNFVGSNNVNMLFPSGQFGTRLEGGKDHAAARYIYTRLVSTTRLLFHPDDDAVLSYMEEEGQRIEPSWYCPIIPTVLVNGASGIGTGWSTEVPNFNPREILLNIRRMLRGEPMQEMLPWYKGFKGTIRPSDKGAGGFEVVGCIQRTSDTTLSITELPIQKWTQPFKEELESLMPKEPAGKRGADDGETTSTITDFREHHTEKNVHFDLTLTREQMRRVEQQGLEKTFKLKTSLATSNMVLFDAEGKIAKYASAMDILQEFCKVRLRVYELRKAYLVAKLTREKEILSNKARFILMVVNGELELRKRKKADLIKDLQRHAFKPMSELNKILEGKSNLGAEEQKEPSANEDDAKDEKASGYDYLLGMNLWSLTFEKVEEIKKQLQVKEQELDELSRTSLEQLWDRDLEALAKGLDEVDAQEAEEAEAEAQATTARRRKVGGRAPAASGRAPAPAQLAPEDKRMLSKPLVDGAAAAAIRSAGAIAKTVSWRSDDCAAPPGKAPRLERAASKQATEARPTEDLEPEQPEKRGRGRPPAEAAPKKPTKGAAAAAEAPARDADSDLLTRLMMRGGSSSAPPTSRSTEEPESFESLKARRPRPERSDDLFASFAKAKTPTFPAAATAPARRPLAERNAHVDLDPVELDAEPPAKPAGRPGRAPSRERSVERKPRGRPAKVAEPARAEATISACFRRMGDRTGTVNLDPEPEPQAKRPLERLLRPAAPVASLQPGAEVLVTGLVNAPELNGTRGTVEALNQETGRWVVCLADGNRKCLKPENLRPQAPAPARPPSAEALAAAAPFRPPAAARPAGRRRKHAVDDDDLSDSEDDVAVQDLRKRPRKAGGAVHV